MKVLCSKGVQSYRTCSCNDVSVAYSIKEVMIRKGDAYCYQPLHYCTNNAKGWIKINQVES